MLQKIPYKIVLPTRMTSFRLWFIGDTHIGAVGFEEHKFKQTVERIRSDPNAYWIGMGDYCDFINFRDKRFDPTQIAIPNKIEDLRDLARHQYGHFLTLTRPIHHKCLFVLTGNHEEKWTKYYHYDIGWYICDQIKCGFGSYESFYIIEVKDKKNDGHTRYTLKGYANHGWGGARTEGAELNKLTQLAIDKDVNLISMGHGHKLTGNIFPRIGIMKGRDGNVKYFSNDIAAVLTGSYLRTYGEDGSGYSAEKGYRAVKLGSPCVEIKLTKERKEDWLAEKIEIRIMLG